MKTHPLASIFPLLDKASLQALADDIKANGQRVPIILLDGAVLDGRNRWLACEIAGVTPTTTAYAGDTTPGALLAFVISTNLNRRHLDESQRATIGARLCKDFDSGTRDAAHSLNVSHTSVALAIKVLDKAPGLVPLVEAGRLAVSDAVKATKEEPETQAAIARIIDKQGGTVAQALRKLEHEAAVARVAEEADEDVAEAVREGFIEPAFADLLVLEHKNTRKRCLDLVQSMGAAEALAMARIETDRAIERHAAVLADGFTEQEDGLIGHAERLAGWDCTLVHATANAPSKLPAGFAVAGTVRVATRGGASVSPERLSAAIRAFTEALTDERPAVAAGGTNAIRDAIRIAAAGR